MTSPDDQAAIVILNGSGYDFGGGCGAAIDQHHQRIFFAAVAVGGVVALFRRGAAVVRDDQLSLLQEFVGYAYAFTEQASGILAQIEDQAFQIAHLIRALRLLHARWFPGIRRRACIRCRA